MIGLEKSFQLIYSNTHLRTRETLPLKEHWFDIELWTKALPILKFSKEIHVLNHKIESALFVGAYSPSVGGG